MQTGETPHTPACAAARAGCRARPVTTRAYGSRATNRYRAAAPLYFYRVFELTNESNIFYIVRDIAPSDRDNQAIWLCVSRRAAGAGRSPPGPRAVLRRAGETRCGGVRTVGTIRFVPQHHPTESFGIGRAVHASRADLDACNGIGRAVHWPITPCSALYCASFRAYSNRRVSSTTSTSRYCTCASLNSRCSRHRRPRRCEASRAQQLQLPPDCAHALRSAKRPLLGAVHRGRRR
jgi:hypothetical protein